MPHREYLRIVPNAKTAVLLLHGICGSPAHFRDLIDLQSVVPGDISVYNICYPGHGGKVTDFGSSRLKYWRSYARQRFLELAETHERVIIVGHSMGTLFAIQLAVEFPNKVPYILLLQCPLQVGLRWFGIKNLLRIPFGAINREDPYSVAIGVACGVEPNPFVWLYIPWIFRLLELFAEMSAAKRLLPQLQTTALAFQSCRDELVSNRSAKLLRQSGRVEVRELPLSSHFYYTPEAKQQMTDAFACILSL